MEVDKNLKLFSWSQSFVKQTVYQVKWNNTPQYSDPNKSPHQSVHLYDKGEDCSSRFFKNEF